MAYDPQNDPFEQDLRKDLWRGVERQPRALGRERGPSARWLHPDEMTGKEWLVGKGLLLGDRAGRSIGWDDDRHMLTIAGSRSGKGVSLIVPNLIEYTGSAIVVDPKGENAARTAGRRGAGPKGGGPGLNQVVHVLDPFGESGHPTSSFNPLLELDLNDREVIDDIGVFAEALIIRPEQGELHWTESAQAVVRAIIYMVAADQRFADRRNLITVRRLLQTTDPLIEKFIETAEAKGETLSEDLALVRLLRDQDGLPYGDICTGVAGQLASMSERERGSILSSARTQTQWLDSRNMRDVLEGGTNAFRLEDLKRRKLTLYLCLPSRHMSTHARWLRLIVMLAMAKIERVRAKPLQPVLFVLDEFPVLGFMQSVETAAGLMAGYGVKLWPILQNLGQLKRHYRHSWQTFIANSGVVTAFGVSDLETLRELANYLGQTNITVQTDALTSRDQRMQGAAAYNEKRDQVGLLSPDEVRLTFGRGKRRMLVFNVETLPTIVKRMEYYDDPRFDGKYDPDPNYPSRRHPHMLAP